MYITITDIIGEKKIDLDYPIRGKEVVVISMFSDNIQYELEKPLKVRQIMKEEMQLLKGKFSSRELGKFIGRKLITTKDGIIKTNKMPNWALSRKDTLRRTAMTTTASKNITEFPSSPSSQSIVSFLPKCMIRYQW